MTTTTAKKDGGVAARFGKSLNPFDKKGWGAVGRSSEFRRVAALPRRTHWDDVSEAMTLAFALPPRTDCTSACVCRGAGYMRLKPRQAWALAEFFERRGGVALLGPGEGKAQPLDAQVLTPTGFVRMGEVQPGMQVCTPDGGSARVLGVYPQGMKKVYRVVFSDGTTTESCDEHLWKVSSKQRRKNERRDAKFPRWEVKPLFEIIKNVDAGYSIPITQPVLFAPQEPLSIDPYLLGVLLGDGSIKYGSISVSTSARDSAHMLTMVQKACVGKGYEPRGVAEDTSAQSIDIRNKQKRKDTIQDALRELSLFGCGSEDKFVPTRYLHASVEDRLALLRGLLDTDGYVSEKSSVSFVSVSKRLADAVVFLTQSLGGVATVTTGNKTFTYKGEKKVGKTFYKVSVRLSVCPFTLPFKMARWTKHSKYFPTRIIRKIEFVGEKQTQCISVDSSDRLYLTDKFIVTHNTLVSLLTAPLLGWQRPVLFVPAGLRDKTVRVDYPALARHWRLPANLDIRSYEELSRVAFADYLSKRRLPDGIICDEVHALKNRGAARTKRLLRYFSEFPGTEFVGMSGSIVNRSIMDYGHLTLLGLKDHAPLPHGFIELKTWADVLDEGVADEARPKPGALLDFCAPGEEPRDGYRRRLLETHGVISSPDLSTNVGLQIFEQPMPSMPQAVVDAFVRLRNTAELPGGEMCATVLEQIRHAKELVLGFYYKWVWPGGVRDDEWLDARRAWRSFVRKTTQRSHGGRYFDTELQVANGVRAGELVCPDSEYETWVRVRDDRKAKWGAAEPPKETVWLSDYMLREVERWVTESDKHTLPGAVGSGSIVWVESIGFLDELRKRGHVCYGAGENGITHEDGKRTVFASMAHTVGKNLQAFSKMLFTSPLTSGKAWEQALAREHRPGQTADDVIVHVYLGCRETWWSFWNARKDARYIEATLGQRQRLNQATIVVTEEQEVVKRHDGGSPLWASTGLARLDAANPQRPVESVESVSETATEKQE